MIGKLKVLLSNIKLVRAVFFELKKNTKIALFLLKYIKNLFLNKCYFSLFFVIIFFIPLLIIFKSKENSKPKNKIPKMQYTLG